MIPRALSAVKALSSRSQSVVAGQVVLARARDVKAASTAAMTSASSSSPGAYISSHMISMTRSRSSKPPRTRLSISRRVSGFKDIVCRWLLKLPLLAPLRLPFGSQTRAVDLLSAQIDLVDLAHIGDVVERIGIKHDEVGALARRHHAELIEPERLRRLARRGHDHLHRREASGCKVLELHEPMQAEPAVAVAC